MVRFEPHREIAFRVKDNFTVWSFTLEPTASGTRVVQRREAPDGSRPSRAASPSASSAGCRSFQVELREGMRTTLAGIKATAEA